MMWARLRLARVPSIPGAHSVCFNRVNSGTFHFRNSTVPYRLTVLSQPSSESSVASSRRWWTLSVVALAQLMVVLDSTVVNIALPAAQADLGFSNADRQWVMTAYS